MDTRWINNELKFFEEKLCLRTDYSSTYMIIRDLHDLIDSHVDAVTTGIIEKLFRLLETSRYESRKTSYFFYREVAEAIVKIASGSTSEKIVRQSINTLSRIFLNSKKNRHRAIAEALGILPAGIHSPPIFDHKDVTIPETDYTECLKLSGIEKVAHVKWVGRSLVSTDDEAFTYNHKVNQLQPIQEHFMILRAIKNGGF